MLHLLSLFTHVHSQAVTSIIDSKPGSLTTIHVLNNHHSFTSLTITTELWQKRTH